MRVIARSASCLAPGEWLLTAHHGDDQLETLLLRLMRGTGVRGLRGIIAFGPFGAGELGRPLLDFTRAQLHAQALAWDLSWIEDPSNREPRQDRNYLRLHVLPALLARWPEAAQRATRLAEQMGDAERLLDALAAEDARPLAAPWHVPHAVLAALEPARQRNLLRYSLRAVGLGGAKREQARGVAHGSARRPSRLAYDRAMARRRRTGVPRRALSRRAVAARLAGPITRRACVSRAVGRAPKGPWNGRRRKRVTACPSRGSPTV